MSKINQNSSNEEALADLVATLWKQCNTVNDVNTELKKQLEQAVSELNTLREQVKVAL